VAGNAEGVIRKRDLTPETVATTVMETGITYPTDSKRYLKSLFRLNRLERQSASGCVRATRGPRSGWPHRSGGMPMPSSSGACTGSWRS